MRSAYALDRFFSRIGDALWPKRWSATRINIYRRCASAASKVNLTWCHWPAQQESFPLVEVSPAAISHQIKDGIVPLIDNTRFWLRAEPFKIHEAVTDIFVLGRDYRETAQYKQMLSRVESGQRAYWCRSQSDVNAYFSTLVEAYESMKRYGYIPSSARQDGGSQRSYPYPNEILVSVGCDGRMYLERGGTHRLSIAKALNISSVWVSVIRRYAGE